MLSRGHHLSLVFLMSVLVSMLASLSLWSLSFVLSVFLSRFCSPSLVFVFVLNDNSNNKHCLSLVSVFGVFVTLVPRHYTINVCIASYFVSLKTHRHKLLLYNTFSVQDSCLANVLIPN